MWLELVDREGKGEKRWSDRQRNEYPERALSAKISTLEIFDERLTFYTAHSSCCVDTRLQREARADAA